MSATPSLRLVEELRRRAAELHRRIDLALDLPPDSLPIFSHQE
jgi:hypothetical protein